MTQTAAPALPAPDPSLLPAARAGRLAARLRGKCLRSGSVEAALQEIGFLDSGALVAMPRLSSDVLDFQRQHGQTGDPLRLFVPRQKVGWPRRRAQLPVLSRQQWQGWQAEVEGAAPLLARQSTLLSVLQARQTQLVADLRADLLVLSLASELLDGDAALSVLWRGDLTSALAARAAELGTALTVAGQLGEALSLLWGHQRLLAGRLDAASRLLLYAAQTGVSLQQALAEQEELTPLP